VLVVVIDDGRDGSTAGELLSFVDFVVSDLLMLFPFDSVL
jgi:hypothetical protein